jgi:hypothetical protein
VDRIARHLDLSEEESQLLRLGALFHDVGHGPMSHATETFLASVANSFDHDEEGLAIVQSPEIRRVLEGHNIDVGALVNLLDDSYRTEPRSNLLRYVLKDVADRTAYLRMDSMALGLSPEAAQAIYKATHAYEESLVIRNDWLFTTDEGAALAMMAARAIVFQEGACHPSSELVRAVFIREGRHLVNEYPDIFDDHADIAQMVDSDLTELFNHRLQLWLGHDMEDHFVVGGAWRFSDLTVKGQRKAQHVDTEKTLQELLYQELQIDPELVYACYTSEIGKAKNISFLKNDQVELKRLSLSARPEHRTFFVVIGEHLDPNTEAAAKKLIAEYMDQKGYKKPDAQSLGREIFGPIDETLY